MKKLACNFHCLIIIIKYYSVYLIFINIDGNRKIVTDTFYFLINIKRKVITSRGA